MALYHLELNVTPKLDILTDALGEKTNIIQEIKLVLPKTQKCDLQQL